MGINRKQDGRCFLGVAGLSLLLFCGILQGDVADRPTVPVKDFHWAAETQRIITAALQLPPERRVVFVSGYFLGRKYRPETKKQIREQRSKPKTATEATNSQPIPLKILVTSLMHLDCMTYVEHVLALASSNTPDYTGVFLPRLIDVMFDAGGAALMNHHRSHFTSSWGDVNERKGYLTNIARGHPAALTRTVLLNKVGTNRTFYVEDRFLIATAPQAIHYFPTKAVLDKRASLVSGDVIAFVCDKEGLDVTHMGFFIELGGKRLLRHASYTLNRIVDQDFDSYLREKKGLLGLMAFRPRLAAPPPPVYQFVVAETSGRK